MRWWKPVLGIAIILVIVVWDIGLPGKHSSSAGSALTPTPSPSATPSAPGTSAAPSAPGTSAVPGVIQPEGKPEFAASFSGSKLDTSVWDTCYPWDSQSGCRNFGNPETEWYLPSQDRVSGGVLHLVAERKATEGTSTSGGPPKQYDCRSGMITSYPGFSYEYGYLQIIARIPSGQGLWAALWLDPANFTWPPEMDLVESYGDAAFAGSYFHPNRQLKDVSREIYTPASQVAGWHIFALSWTRTQMTWLVDGKVTMTVRSRIPHEKMIIIANLATLGVGRANQCSGQLLIRSVDVWKA
jgi:beta-glucanase (GH16 family)